MSFVSEVIADLGGAHYTVKRVATGSRVAGVYTKGAESTLTIYASIQPSQKKNVAGGDGQTTEGVYDLVTDTELFTQETATHPDTVIYLGREHKVITANTFDVFGDIQCEATIVRQGNP